MANVISVTVFQRNASALKNPNGTPATAGVTVGLPVNQLTFTGVKSGTTVYGVTMNAQVIQTPTGLNQPPVTWYTSATVAQLITASNAALA